MTSEEEWRELVPPPIRPGSGDEAIFTFFKFGQQHHVEHLHRTGKLYMRALGSFVDIEDGQVRGDPDEGLAMHFQHRLVQVQIGDIVIKPEDMAAPIRVAYNERRALHVFSMFALTTRGVDEALAGRQAVDPRMVEFGEAALLVTNASAFLERVVEGAKKANVNIACSLVYYLDPATHHGAVSPFNKMKAYEWQSEYRIVMGATGQHEAFLDLGPLDDISVVVRAADIGTALKIGLKP